jgi:hemerythrin superfamily protein
MNALDLLEEQHREIEDHFEAIEATDDQDEREAHFARLADALVAHTTAEERLFYPMMKTEETEELMQRLVEEHLAVKRLLADLIELNPMDEQFDAKLALAKQQLLTHIYDEEEGSLFPVARRLFDADALEGLGNELLAIYEELIDTEPRLRVGEETAEAPRL